MHMYVNTCAVLMRVCVCVCTRVQILAAEGARGEGTLDPSHRPINSNGLVNTDTDRGNAKLDASAAQQAHSQPTQTQTQCEIYLPP